MWFPTALLPTDKVQWQAIDDQHAQVTLHDHHTDLSLAVTFAPDGLIAQVEGLRYRQPGEPPVRWGGKVLAYDTFDEIHVPSEIEVYWHSDRGYELYFRSKITDVEYNRPEVY